MADTVSYQTVMSPPLSNEQNPTLAGHIAVESTDYIFQAPLQLLDMLKYPTYGH